MNQNTRGNPWNIAILVLRVSINSKLLCPQQKSRPSFEKLSGVLYTEFLTKGLTVNSDRYCAILRSLKQRIHRIISERNVFLLHHGNARPHCSAQTQDVMAKLIFTVVPQPPYSPDLAPLNF
ncbi:hypothetical protein TNCV_2269421 [Trichonephila clavipes]|nr:hypothetical protein TNCV_2269421 [Trichonephila clavipes]